MTTVSRVIGGRQKKNKSDTSSLCSSSSSSSLHDLIARLDYTAALERLQSHPHESQSSSPSPSSTSRSSSFSTQGTNRRGNSPLAEIYRLCLTTATSSVGIPPPPFEFVEALVRSFPMAVMLQILGHRSSGNLPALLPLGDLTPHPPGRRTRVLQPPGNDTGRRVFLPPGRRPLSTTTDDIDGMCRGFTPLHALCFLSRRSTAPTPTRATCSAQTRATLATMLQTCPQAVHVSTPITKWLPLHAACAPADPTSPTPDPPRVTVIRWLVGTFPGSVTVENKGGACPLTMFWQRYYVPPEWTLVR